MEKRVRSMWPGRCLGILFVLVLLAAFPAEMAEASSSSEEKSAVVKVALYEGRPNLFTDSSGKAAGFFADLLEEIARLEGWRLEYVPGAWAEGLERLHRGEVDLVSSLARTEEREKIYAYSSVPAIAAWSTAYVASESPILSLLDLRGKKVALLEGSIQQSGFIDFIRGFDLGLTLLPVPEEETGFAMVSRGDADAVISVRTTGEIYRSRYGLKETAIMFNPREAYYAASAGDPKGLIPSLDAHLERMKKNPDSPYYEIVHRWFPESPQRLYLPLWIRAAMGVVLGFILFSLAMMIMLRWQVKKRTAELLGAKEDAEKQNLRLQEEIRERLRIEEILRQHEARLEELVSERTRDLRKTNEELQREIAERRQVEEELFQKKEQLRRISDNLVEGFIYQVACSPAGDARKFLYVSAGVTSILDISSEEIYADSMAMYTRIHPCDLERFRSEEIRVLEAMSIFNLEGRFSLPDGTVRWLRLSSTPYLEKDGSVIWDGIAMDITERKSREQELRESREQFKALAEYSEDVIMRFDRQHRHLYVNPAAEVRTGIKPEAFVGKTHEEMGFPKDLARLWGESIERVFLTAKPVQLEFQLPGGHWMDWLLMPELSEGGEVMAVISAAREVTERKLAEEKIREISFSDSLTGLYNRRYLEQEMQKLDIPEKLPLTVVMADSNGLKLVNDTYGHAVGDEMLRAIARILQESCGSEGLLARWGGDEFVILLPCTETSRAGEICRTIADRCRVTLVRDIPVSISLGIAQKTSEEEKLGDVLSRAEDDMYKRKLAESRSVRSGVVSALLKALGAKSCETEEHTRRMEVLALKIGERAGLPESELKRLSLVVILHDIGKIHVDEAILGKEGPLTPEEWEIIRKHPETGSRIARSTEDFAHVAEDILAHHERWDGTGYPRGLQKRDIPLLARITAIVDAYDVMTHGRPYKESLSEEEALEECRRCSGTQFDPELVELFLEISASF